MSNNNPKRFQSDEFKELLRGYEDSVKNASSSFYEVETYVLLIEYYFFSGKLNKAESLISQSLEQYHFSTPLLVKQAHLFLERGEISQVHEAIEHIKILDGSESELPFLESRIKILESDFKGAEEILNTAISKADKSDKIDYLFELAEISDIQLFHDKEYNYLLEILNIEENNEEALVKISANIEQTELYEDSVKLHKQVIENHPYSLRAWHNLGLAYFGLELYEKSIEALSYALAINDEYLPSIRETGDAYFEMEDYEQALEYFLKATSLSSQPNEELYYNLAYTHFNLNNNKKAIFYMDKALKVDPNYDDVYFLKGELYKKEGHFKKALIEYDKAIKIDEDNAEFLESYAVLSYQMGNFKTALEYFTRALDSDSSNKQLWLKLARTYYELGYISESFDVFQKSIEILGDDPELINLASLCLFKLGRKETASELLTISLNLNYSSHKIIFDWDESAIEHQEILDLIEQNKP